MNAKSSPAFTSTSQSHHARPGHLLCDQMVSPLGIDNRHPRFSWRVATSAKDASQTAYQILVASSEALLAKDCGDLWDSGVVVSSTSTNVAYAGSTLKSRQTCHWKVRIWDERNRTGEFSEVATFEMGLLEADDWNARWVGLPGRSAARARYFRVEIDAPESITKARLYVTGLGYYEAYLNGSRLGRAVLEPAYTDSGKVIGYQTFDVTEQLKPGKNVLSAIVGSGWHSSTILLAQLEVETASGVLSELTPARNTTTPVWLAKLGPIISNSIFEGETYDARLETPGWDTSSYDPGQDPDRTRKWASASFMRAPTGKLAAHLVEPIEVMRSLSAKSLSEPCPGIHVFDFGQNHAGWVRLRTQGASGQSITLRYAETLNADGTVNQDNLRGATATDVYMLRGEGEEIWEPRFTYHGYRYVQVEGWPGRPALESLVSQVVRSAVPFRGKFTCNVPLLNRIHQMVRWTEESNLHSLPTDCPQRDERMGWLNDLAARSEELIHNFECSRFLRKFVNDIARAQDPVTGAVSDTVPFHWGGQPADPVSVCYLLIPHLLDQHHKDISLLAENYAGFQRWVEYLSSRSQDHLVTYSYYGDWAPPAAESIVIGDHISPNSAGTPGVLVSTAFYFYATTLLATFSRRLGKSENANRYGLLADEIRRAFHKEFWKGPQIGYGSGNQACNSLALYLDLTPADLRPDVVSALLRDIEANEHHLTTGNLCTKYLLEVLAEEGHFDVAYRIATKITYPSWGYMLEQGATTLWERWENLTGGGMNSHNHPMLGSIGSWLYRRVAGITIAESDNPTPHFEIRIPYSDRIQEASASLETSWGEVSVSWRRNSEAVRAMVAIPWNCTGEIHLGDKTHPLGPGHHDISHFPEDTLRPKPLFAQPDRAEEWDLQPS
jgi:alpha-L-rhamnosidase